MGLADKEIIDIELDNPKRKYRINGDNNSIIELNPSDVGIVTRLKEVYKKLDAHAKKAGSLLADKEEQTTEESITQISNALIELDKDMRDLVDYLFDSPVSAVVAKDQNMYNIYNGQFWYEHIIEVLSGLYENNFSDEFKKMSERVKKHTDKYTRKR